MFFRILRRRARRLAAWILPTLDLLVRPRRRSYGTKWAGFVRLDRIGDFILWLPFAETLSTHYRAQGLRTYLVAHQTWSQLAVATGYWDDVIAVDPARAEWHLIYRWMCFRKAARHDTEILLCPAYSREFVVGDTLCHVIRAKHKIAYAGDAMNSSPSDLARGNRWYTQLVAPDPQLIHETEINRHFTTSVGVTRALGFPSTLPSAPPHHVRLPARSYVIVAPGAAVARKMWPVQRFIRVSRHMVERYGKTIVLVGSSSERTITRTIARALNDDCDDLAGRLSLLELVHMVAKAHSVLANDSAVAHIAAAFDVPGVAIVGGGHFGRFMPYPAGQARKLATVYTQMPCYGCKWSCHFPLAEGDAFPCVSAVSETQVLEAIDGLLLGAQR